VKMARNKVSMSSIPPEKYDKAFPSAATEAAAAAAAGEAPADPEVVQPEKKGNRFFGWLKGTKWGGAVSKKLSKSIAAFKRTETEEERAEQKEELVIAAREEEEQSAENTFAAALADSLKFANHGHSSVRKVLERIKRLMAQLPKIHNGMLQLEVAKRNLRVASGDLSKDAVLIEGKQEELEALDAEIAKGKVKKADLKAKSGKVLRDVDKGRTRVESCVIEMAKRSKALDAQFKNQEEQRESILTGLQSLVKLWYRRAYRVWKLAKNGEKWFSQVPAAAKAIDDSIATMAVAREARHKKMLEEIEAMKAGEEEEIAQIKQLIG